MSGGQPDLRLAVALAVQPITWSDGGAGAQQLVLQHGLQALRAALETAAGQPAAGWLDFWRGYVAQFDDLMLARAHWLTAERCFEQQADATGLELAACGLVQCMLLDSQPCEQLEPRMSRVLEAEPPADARTPLNLFRLAARFAVDAQNFDGQTVDPGVVERMFAALGADDLDTPVRLRGATAAMYWIGRSFDRPRAADFHEAGARLAASATVSPYNRLLWQIQLSAARWRQVDVTARLDAELDAAMRDAPGPACRHLVAAALMMRALTALGANDSAAARTHLAAARPLLAEEFPLDRALWHHVSSRQWLAAGDLEAAAADATLSMRICEATHDLASDVVPILVHGGALQAALGRHDDAAASFARAAEVASGAQAVPALCQMHLARALGQVGIGAHDEARADLRAGLAQARSIGHVQFFHALPTVAAQVCAAALDLDVDAEYARQVAAARSLECPDPGVREWPHRLRVHALGGFSVERDRQPMGLARKVPRRMLDALRLLVALGGRQVDMVRVAALLWGDGARGEARDALKTTLHRLRALFGADALVVRHGQISFDPRTVWIDTWGLDHVTGRIEVLLAGGAATHQRDGELERRRVQLLALYRGAFLGASDVPSWALAARERWRSRFIRSIALLGAHLERSGRVDAAIALYLTALERETLAEELHERVIECYLQRGEQAQALNAFRRCRDLLSMMVGSAPTARMQALRARIAGA